MSKSSNDKRDLVGAYHELLQAVRDVVDASPLRLDLAALIEKARETVDDVKAFSQSEFENTRYFVRRDLQDMLQHARQSEKELADWLHIDMSIAEGGLRDLFAAVADPTRVELDELIAAGFHSEDYLSDEVTGPGHLECAACGARIAFDQPTVIPACSTCNGRVFRRPRS